MSQQHLDPELKRIIDERDNLAMMQTPIIWSRWPLLPLKRRSTTDPPFECGFMMDGPIRVRPRVYLALIWNVNAENIETIPFKDYDSFEEIVADGWVVD